MIEIKKQDPESIDYVGVNIAKGHPMQEKIYYKHRKSIDVPHPLISHMDSLGMVRYVTAVSDGVSETRFDVGLKNRTEAHISDLCSYIAQLSPLYEENKEEIEYFSKMEVDARETYSRAALYFFGFMENRGVIQGIKFHYITRRCRNSDILHKNVRFDDPYYSMYIDNSTTSEFRMIMPAIRNILCGMGGHLWMVGLDYFKNGSAKHKTYVKEPTNFELGKFEKILREDAVFCDVADCLPKLQSWREANTEFVLEGLALGINAGEPTINFYFRYIHDSSHTVTEE